ncbi:leucine efflux protein LeuE [Lacisediminimonas sp.]|uniref:leucine efflux protein LeuE n=1 Tax=Lacisediminimonas sp. TaxID=3060582 RepID=UPI002716A095|nr:leucine efflux protein LeuE [Lacisediminimonas sp.]MDO8298403.1 leucine efflux protein LeuE [Lacisediminimonas sp.]MDO9217299.1 leucine efflux protein LeuE [Lacisediminimonas sp.]
MIALPSLAQLGVTDPWQLIATTAAFLMLPGPGTMCLLTCTSQRGVRGGYAALFGLMLADAVLMLLAALGVAALLQANPRWFTGVQYLGAAYLCWLGLRLLLAKGEGGGVVLAFSNLADLRRGFMVTLLNPKAIVFYMAFFPLFIDPATHRGAPTFIAIGTIILVCTLIWGSLLVLAGNAAASRLKNNRKIAALSSKFAGLFLIGFGIKMSTN